MGKSIGVTLANGEHYKSLNKLCEHYKISKKTIVARTKQGMTIDEAINTTRDQIEYKGVMYKSKTALAEAFGLTYGQLKSRLARMSLDEALHYKAKELNTYNIVGNDGVGRNIKETCDELGVSQQRIYYIARRMGISPIEVIERGMYHKVQHQERYVIVCMLGEFSSIAKLAKVCNLQEATLTQRIKSGVDIDVALVIPVVKSKEYRLKPLFCGLNGKAYYTTTWSSKPVTARQIVEHYRPDLLEAYDKANPTGEYNPYNKGGKPDG